jgi:hypothetical protein
VRGVSIGLTGCVDPAPPHNTPAVTGDDGIASFANNPIQFCFGAALETCGWTVSYNNALVAFNGPTVSHSRGCPAAQQPLG